MITKKDKLAIWSFLIIILISIGDFLNIYEFGSITNYLNYVTTGFSFFIAELILITQLVWNTIGILASVYLFIVYPIKLLRGK